MEENRPVFVLDSFAILAHFQAEAGGEVVYLTARQRGHKTAESIWKYLRSLPITFYEASEERILAAAWIKASHAVSYADSFAIALTQELKGTLVTGDPEFETVKDLQVLWLVVQE